MKYIITAINIAITVDKFSFIPKSSNSLCTILDNTIIIKLAKIGLNKILEKLRFNLQFLHKL